jgi:hypothetical protein
MSTTASREILAPTSFATRFLRHDPLVAVRSITKALVGIWPEQSRPKNPSVMSKRAKVMNRQADPIAYCYTLTIGGLDEGKSLDVVTQWAKDLIAFATQYAERRPVQGSGVLPFRQTFSRIVASGCLEEGQANSAVASVDENDVGSIDRAIAQLIEEIEADEQKVEKLRARKVELLTAR